MRDIYYAPEDYGLTIVGEADDGGGYDFDKFVVWKDNAGTFYWAADAGCSCPSPFEDFHGIEDLTKGTKHEAVAAAQKWQNEYGEDYRKLGNLIELVMGSGDQFTTAA